MLNRKSVISHAKKLLKPFKINGKPIEERFTEGQYEIAGSIIFKINPRIACIAPTGYGKSEAVAVGTLYRTIFKKEFFTICSVKYGTSDIIMSKVIDHLFDDDFFTYQIELEKGQRLDRLKRERKKDSVNYREGGGIKIASLHGKDDDISKVIGEHVPNLILDESPLLTAAKYFQVLKILEGTGSYASTFLFELGNAVNRNHFMKNIKRNPKYHVIEISPEQAIKEGRLDPESMEEKKDMPFYKEFYLNQFPDAEEMDERGFRLLLTEEQIEAAFIDEIIDEPMKLGIDVGGGGDYNSFCLRGTQQAWIDRENKSNDTMTNVSEAESIVDTHPSLSYEEVFIDDIGIGRGVSDRMLELDRPINAISVGSASKEPGKFANIKAEAYWKARTWIINGGKLKRDPRFYQLAWIKYKTNSDKVLLIEPKEELKKREGKSPDHAESFMLTFAPNKPLPGIGWI